MSGYILRTSKNRVRQVSSAQFTANPPSVGQVAYKDRLRDNRVAKTFNGRTFDGDLYTQEFYYSGGDGFIDCFAILGLTDIDGNPIYIETQGANARINFFSDAAYFTWPNITPWHEDTQFTDGKGNYFYLPPDPIEEKAFTGVRFRVPGTGELSYFYAGEFLVGLREEVHPAKHLTYEAITPTIYNGEFAEQVDAPFDRITVEFIPSKTPVQLPTEPVLWWPSSIRDEAYFGRFLHPFTVTRDDNGIYRTSAVFEEARRPFNG